eukprot:CAMPEP_0194305978 /NCGR_PEP_ID=MMETSP0171-20130528/3267_1 /TAXON_ID=218684 /ORGANISM="Corethron pennatum, Strain L29A3" /LENGTH=494 /DNA_ID=CAMNT_0039057649 /DNA_START=26 /DNA_END=1510 /DNA_ORIENTATION=+
MDSCRLRRVSSPSVQLRTANSALLLLFYLLSLAYLFIDPAAAADDRSEPASFSVFRNGTGAVPLRGGRRRLASASPPLRGNPYMTDDPKSSPFRILYVVTTFYSQGRWRNIMVPNIRAVTESVSVAGWDMDVVVIVGNEGPTPTDRKALEDALPRDAALEIWENACALGYEKTKEKVSCITRVLARQHRFVVADRKDEYDFFACWEDDMRFDVGTIRYYLELSAEIDRLSNAAAPDLKTDPDAIDGPMSPQQLQRVVPGFIRVEVVRDRAVDGVKTGIEPDREVVANWVPDASRCCSAPAWDTRLPRDPEGSELMTWECRIHGMSVRRFPEPIGWAALIPGPRYLPKKEVIGSRWAGASGAFGFNKKPGEREPQLFAQQGGWMATREQVLYFDKACPEGFLPPFKNDRLRKHGMDPSQPHNVEFWSGGYQLFGTCNIQRIMSLDPARFSGHLLYHSSNNKQNMVNPKRHVRVSDLYGELITVKKETEVILQSSK